MQKFFFALLVLLVSCAATAQEYGRYDLRRLTIVSETPEGKQHSFDVAYLTQILDDLASHAIFYPPKFDTPQDQQRAIEDTKTLASMLDILIDIPNPDPVLLIRAARINSIGHNLNIAGAAQKADAIFQKLLAINPCDPQANHMYGDFLTGSNSPKQAIPYLEKAIAAGDIHAHYSLGIAHLSLGNKAQALKSLEIYKRHTPSDTEVAEFIDAIRNGRVEFKTVSN